MQDELTKLFIVAEHLRSIGRRRSNGWGSNTHGNVESLCENTSRMQWERVVPDGQWRSVPYFGLPDV